MIVISSSSSSSSSSSITSITSITSIIIISSSSIMNICIIISTVIIIIIIIIITSNFSRAATLVEASLAQVAGSDLPPGPSSRGAVLHGKNKSTLQDGWVLRWDW